MKRVIKNKIDKAIKVVWMDACSLKKDIYEYKEMKNRIVDGTEFLVKNTTSGILKDIFEKVIVVETERSTDGDIEVTVIPRNWILKPKMLQEE